MSFKNSLKRPISPYKACVFSLIQNWTVLAGAGETFWLVFCCVNAVALITGSPSDETRVSARGLTAGRGPW